MSPALAILIQTAPVTSPWYQGLPTIIGIPSAIIGVPYAWVLLRKTGLEARRTELEIQEKMRQLGLEGKGAASVTILDEYSPVRSYRVSSLILRYILLQLIVSASGLITAPVELLLMGLIYGALWVAGGATMRSDVTVLVTIATSISRLAASAVYWTLFLVIGWPLFKDILAFFGIAASDLGWRSVWRSGRNWRALVGKVNAKQESQAASGQP